MLRNYQSEFESRVQFISDYINKSGAAGIVFGNSGGKDCALVGILCKAACENTVGIIMPCLSKRNFEEDMTDGFAISNQFGIETRTIDLSDVKTNAIKIIGGHTELNNNALSNMAPRLRMLTLYAVAASENRIVAGTGNRSEIYMGYFTKWGDGGYDFNPIADLTVTEVYEFLEFLDAPQNIINKAPSAGLFEGQTDEKEMGISYAKIDDYLLDGNANKEDIELIESFHNKSAHKRKMPATYAEYKQ